MRLIFSNRVAAGRLLAEKLAPYAGRSGLLVLALPRGGVPVAAEVAHGLQAPLDVLVVRKLGAPFNPEFALGAVASGGFRVINTRGLEAFDVPPVVLKVGDRAGRKRTPTPGADVPARSTGVGVAGENGYID